VATRYAVAFSCQKGLRAYAASFRQLDFVSLRDHFSGRHKWPARRRTVMRALESSPQFEPRLGLSATSASCEPTGLLRPGARDFILWTAIWTDLWFLFMYERASAQGGPKSRGKDVLPRKKGGAPPPDCRSKTTRPEACGTRPEHTAILARRKGFYCNVQKARPKPRLSVLANPACRAIPQGPQRA